MIPNGGDRKSEEWNQYNNCNTEKRQGNDPEYFTARIARDRPDILEEMKEGKHRSIRAAGVKAGIVKDEYKMQISGVDPIKAAKTIFSAIEHGKIDVLYVNALIIELTNELQSYS